MSVRSAAARIAARLVDRTPGTLARRLGSTSTGARLLRPLVNRALPQGEQVVEVRSGRARGLRLVIDVQREKYYWTGAYEPHVQDALARLARPGATVWDVGAHAGFFSLLAARAVGGEGRVVAVEPSSATRARLERALDLNDLHNVTVVPAAAAGASGSVVLHDNASTSKRSIVGAGEGETVRAVTLDELAAEHGRPDVVKLDVEEAEVEVLAASELVRADDRPALIVEFTDADAVARARTALPGASFEQIGARHWVVT